MGGLGAFGAKPSYMTAAVATAEQRTLAKMSLKRAYSPGRDEEIAFSRPPPGDLLVWPEGPDPERNFFVFLRLGRLLRAKLGLFLLTAPGG